MIDLARVLRPLDDAADAVRRLGDYATPDELAAAVREVRAAVERALRLLLREDASAADDLRLSALAPDALPLPGVLDALRRRDRISLELAGRVHELERAGLRATSGDVRAADADLARAVVERLRAEARAAAETPSAAPAATGTAPEPVSRVPEEEAEAPSGAGAIARGRPLALIAAAVALLALVSLVLVVVRGWNRGLDDAIAAFDAGQYTTAETRFREVAESAPENVTARLYLGRIYRRQGEYALAAEHLRAAAQAAPGDADVRRELGHLFLDLGRPERAAAQYRRALELDPDEVLSWYGLVRALRAAGDPAAEEVLRRAPAEVRAALTNPN